MSDYHKPDLPLFSGKLDRAVKLSSKLATVELETIQERLFKSDIESEHLGGLHCSPPTVSFSPARLGWKNEKSWQSE